MEFFFEVDTDTDDDEHDLLTMLASLAGHPPSRPPRRPKARGE